jgi:hypothetical protein
MVNILSYEDIRSQIKNADILLYRGTDTVSRGIRWLSRSQYSHAGLVVWWNDRLMVLEAVGNGVVAMPLSMNLKKHHGGIDYFRAKENIPEEVRLKMVIFAQEQLGKQYAFSQMAVFGFKLLLRMSMSPKEKRANGASGQYFCSQYVSDTYLKQGYDLAIQYGNRYTSPDALAKSEKLVLTGVLRKG